MLTVYRILADLIIPVLLRIRLVRGKEDSARLGERLGVASCARPEGKLLWCHAASVGEALAALTLINAITEKHPDWRVLLTTGTVTSAGLISSRLPARALHQYAPLDRAVYVATFLDHWRPDLALWIESELWPNTLLALKSRAIPTLLANGRMSQTSYRRWQYVAHTAQTLLSAFSLGLAQTPEDAARFSDLGLKKMCAPGNLKYAADPLPHDPDELARLREKIDGRPLWLMASTHPGEEAIALDTHRLLAARYPGLLTIIAPRHPNRGEAIAAFLQSQKVSFSRRSSQDPLTPETAVYLADTMGELGLFYRLSSLVCLAGSFTWGGHNPIEPALLACAVVFGPRMDNFQTMAASMLESGGAQEVKDSTSLAACLSALMDAPQKADQQAQAARQWAESKRAVLDDTMTLLHPFLTQDSKVRS